MPGRGFSKIYNGSGRLVGYATAGPRPEAAIVDGYMLSGGLAPFKRARAGRRRSHWDDSEAAMPPTKKRSKWAEDIQHHDQLLRGGRAARNGQNTPRRAGGPSHRPPTRRTTRQQEELEEVKRASLHLLCHCTATGNPDAESVIGAMKGMARTSRQLNGFGTLSRRITRHLESLERHATRGTLTLHKLYWAALAATPKTPENFHSRRTIGRKMACAAKGQPRIWTQRRYQEGTWQTMSERAYHMAEKATRRGLNHRETAAAPRTRNFSPKAVDQGDADFTEALHQLLTGVNDWEDPYVTFK